MSYCYRHDHNLRTPGFLKLRPDSDARGASSRSPLPLSLVLHGSIPRNYPSCTFMGLTFALNDYDKDQCSTAYGKREKRTADFKERIQNIAALGRHRVGREKMKEWTRQMQETLMHCKAANGGVVKECLMNEESWRELNRILEIMMSRLTAGSTIVSVVSRAVKSR